MSLATALYVTNALNQSTALSHVAQFPVQAYRTDDLHVLTLLAAALKSQWSWSSCTSPAHTVTNSLLIPSYLVLTCSYLQAQCNDVNLSES